MGFVEANVCFLGRIWVELGLGCERQICQQEKIEKRRISAEQGMVNRENVFLGSRGAKADFYCRGKRLP
jgi:hypothetical protein